MPTILEFLTEYKADVAEVVDKTYERLNLSDSPLEKYFPTIGYADIELALQDIEEKPTLAQVVGNGDIPDTVPVAKITERTARKLSIGKKRVYTDKDYDLMRKFELYMMSRGASSSAMLEGIKAKFFGNISGLVTDIRRKSYMIMMKLAQQAAISYTDPLTEYTVSLTYEDTFADLMLPALTAGNRWSQTATATGLLNLRIHSDAYYDHFYRRPDALWLRTKNMRELRDQQATQTAYVSRFGINVDASQISGVDVPEMALMDLIKDRTGVKEVIVFDNQYYEENKDDPSNPTSGNFLDEDRYMFLEEGNQRLAAIPSPENNWDSGVALVSEEVQKIPYKTQTIAYQRLIPLFRDSRKIASRDVN